MFNPGFSLTLNDCICLSVGLWFVSIVSQRIRQYARATSLRGPPRPSWLFGVNRILSNALDAGVLYEGWAKEYGSVCEIPAILGSTRVVLFDPKAIAHFYATETFTYVNTRFSKYAIENLIGRGLLYSEGESHKRQRRAISPAFSNAAIRKLTPVFFDSAYKVKAAWDGLIEAGNDSAIIEVQAWMNRVSLDSIGIAGFSHNFGSLEGKHSAVASVFDDFTTVQPSKLNIAIFMMGSVIPWLIKLPTRRGVLTKKLNNSLGEIADQLLKNTRGNEATGNTEEKSIIGLLIKAEGTDSDLHMTQEEVLSQMKVLILAGYETTSISLTWALIELCKKPEVQRKLNKELSQFSSGDPSWDQLTNTLPYLDAVVHEVLRLHPPLGETNRVATVDDVIPLSVPLHTASGTIVDRITVTKGTRVTVPIRAVNRSEEMWGPDAKEFKPERWLDESNIKGRAAEIQGHRHILTFVDGPRTCLGRGFALAEFKAVLSVLIRSYSFEFKDGLGTKIGIARGILPRPKVEGEMGVWVPLLVRRRE